MKAILPIRSLVGVTQGMNGSTSHLGLKAIDFGWNSSYKNSKVLYAPFDCKVVARLGNTNTIAVESLEPVEYVDGTIDYMTVITAHDNNAPKLNTIFKQGEVYSHMGTATNVACHCHLEVQKGKYKPYTEIKKTGQYKSLIFPNTIEPYKALFLAKGTVLGKSATYDWKYEEEDMSLITIAKEDGYEYKWSVDGNKYGDQYDITTSGGFGDQNLINDGWEEVLAINGGLFYTYENKHYACGIEKSRGVNNQELEMACVTNYNNAGAIACIDDELWFARQDWIIKNKLEQSYGALTGMMLVLGGKAVTYNQGFESQFNQISGRTIIGEDSQGNILSYSFAGETGKSGLSGKQCQDKCLELGFENALMLDGGGSVFRRYLGKPSISTSRKVKNALLLYRKKKEIKPIEPTEDYKAKYNELLAKYNDLNQQYELLIKHNEECEKGLELANAKLQQIREIVA